MHETIVASFFQKKAKKTLDLTFKRPEGMNREVFNLIRRDKT